jgi:hypothetical protein
MNADLIFVNGNIITMSEENSNANSIVVKDGYIEFVGDYENAKLWKSDDTEVIDLEEKTMLPGFIESHIHPTLYGMNLLELDCRPIKTPTIKSILDKVEREVEKTPAGQWIRGWGWDDSKLEDKRIPAKKDLDKVAPNHPVILKRTCGHMAVVNSKALEISGITKDTENPKGGHIVRETDTGELTGLLQEKAQGMAAVPEYSLDEIVEGMKLAQKDFAKWGITTVHDMSTQTEELKVYQYLLEKDELEVRIRPWIWAIDQNGWKGSIEEVLTVGLRSGFGNDMIRIQGMKFMLDGSVGGKTAAVKEPYENSNETGILYNTAEEIAPYFKKSLEAGLRVAVHGIGERAIEVAVKSFEEAQKDINIRKMRNRVEHVGLPTDEHLKRIKNLELIAASSIGFLYHIGDSYMKNLGPERIKRAYPHKSFKDYNIIAPGNSDLPVTEGNPWTGIYAAVTRKTITGQVLDTEQNIPVIDALKAYTVNAAYSSFEENLIGVIKPKAKADLIVLSEDPLKMDAENLKDIEVEKTYREGQLIFSQK